MGQLCDGGHEVIGNRGDKRSIYVEESHRSSNSIISGKIWTLNDSDDDNHLHKNRVFFFSPRDR